VIGHGVHTYVVQRAKRRSEIRHEQTSRALFDVNPDFPAGTVAIPCKSLSDQILRDVTELEDMDLCE